MRFLFPTKVGQRPNPLYMGQWPLRFIRFCLEQILNSSYVCNFKANYETTKAVGAEMAGALSAVREQSKEYRPGGDKRTGTEVQKTMDVNKAGRERALNENKHQHIVIAMTTAPYVAAVIPYIIPFGCQAARVSSVSSRFSSRFLRPYHTEIAHCS